MEVKRTERGWAAHSVYSDMCRFRRNTLLEYGDRKWVVSTVGGFINSIGKVEQIDFDTWYETLAFEADENGEADYWKQIYFESPWVLKAKTYRKLLRLYPNPDLQANEMHEKVVNELSEKIVITVE